ncbi:MAG: 2-dehydropantoate 2-reductase, partial [Sandaracinobacteroides sp.]
AIFGAGMIGLYIGGLLARHADVMFIGRGSMLAPLADGLRLTDTDGLDLSLSSDQFVTATDPAALADCKLVLVTVKSMATPEAAAAIAAYAPADALVISFQNGVSNPETLRLAAGTRTVLAGMVPFNIAQLGPAHFHRGTAGNIAVDLDSALVPWEQIFASSGIPLHTSSNMPGVQWGKLLVNLNNAINAVSGVSLANELRQRDYRRAWALSMAEGLPLVKAAGIDIVDPLPMPLKLMPQIMRLPDKLYRYVLSAGSGGKVKVDPHARSSMADDLAKGRATEVDFLQGEVVRLAERLGRKAPVNARLLQLVKAAEAGAPPIPAAKLLADLQAARR